ncbi:MAG: prepilin peptidase [Mitsuokella sp.]
MMGRDGLAAPKKSDILFVICIWLALAFGNAMHAVTEVRVVSGICFSFGLVVMAFTDIRWGLLFDKLNILFFVAGIVSLYMEGLSFPMHLAGCGLGGLFLYGLRLMSHGGLGLGDVKYGMVLGFWLGPLLFYASVLIAFVLGGLFAVVLIVRRQIHWKAHLPFGPFLSIGAYIGFLYRAEILTWYWALL